MSDKFELKKAIVGYIDLLGFKNRLSKPVDTNLSDLYRELKFVHNELRDNNSNKEFYDKIDKINTRIKLIENPKDQSEMDILFKSLIPMFDDYELDNEGPYSYNIFSDSFIIHSYINEEKEHLGNDVFPVFKKLLRIQWNLALRDIFIRGGIAIGQSFLKSKIMFSPAFLKAYELENKKAIYPRVIIDNNIKDLFLEIIRSFSLKDDIEVRLSKYFVIDSDDGAGVLNYLMHPIIDGFKDKYLNDAYHKHKAIVIKNLKENKHDCKKLPKYIWVAEYHNWFCHTEFSDNKDLIIDVAKVLSSTEKEFFYLQ